MIRANHAKIVIASAVALIGAVVAWRAIFPNHRSTEGEVAPPEPIPTEGFPAVADVRFDAFPAREPVGEIVDRARRRLIQLLVDAHPEWVSSSSGRIEKLVALAGDRLALLLAPDYEQWVEQVHRFDGYIPEQTEQFRDRWSRSASRLAAVPLSIEQMWVRARWRGGVREEASRTAIYLSPSISGKYAAAALSPEASQLDVYEVLIPMGFRSRDATTHDNIVIVGMQFAWMKDGAEWSPFGMTVYQPMSAFSGKWILPPVW